MSDILSDAREWLRENPVGERMGRAHDSECHRRHLECLVSRMAAEIERLREERRWISVEERLPELNEANRFRVSCLVSCKGGAVCEMDYEINTYAKREQNKRPRWKWHGMMSMQDVTHWMALPAPQEEEKQP